MQLPPWPLVVLLLVACSSPTADSSAFTTSPTSPPGLDTSSTGAFPPSSSSTTGADTTTTASSTSSTSSDTADTFSEPARDLGTVPDFGDGAPIGCKGKIDFLFVISRAMHMGARQAQLALAVPHFIDTIAAKFADFDYHIMVIDGDGPPPAAWWGDSICNEVCPNLACKIGEPCCPIDVANYEGLPCCNDPNYPCDKLELVSKCDEAWGAGVVFPAGKFTADKPCPIDGGRRYLVKGQTDLHDTFACIAKVGNSGYMALGQALTAAVQKPINDPGGCNPGFLRKDALLMVTLIATNGDWDSEGGTPADWAKAVIDAKHGDDEAIVMLNIGFLECVEDDRLCRLAASFPFHHLESIQVEDYGPAFAEAAGHVETACAGFVVPG